MMHTNKDLKEVFKGKNHKVLLMLSGGKDSSASLCMLKSMEVDVTAIHFKHKWGYELSTKEARRICNMLDVELIEVDFTHEFTEAVSGFYNGRPCLMCKKEMYKIVLEHIELGAYNALCIGDNADDKTTINRLMKHISDKDDENIYFSSYFGSEQGISLPDSFRVVRPVLDLKSHEVEAYLLERGIKIAKNHSTGDKYFEYSREGCPIQFHDPGTSITVDSMDRLKTYDDCITAFAKKKGIKASIHLPSTLIVTIPKGFEEEAYHYLTDCGLDVDYNMNRSNNLIDIDIVIENLLDGFFENDVHQKMFSRFLERLNITNLTFGNELNVMTASDESKLFTFDYSEKNILRINYSGTDDININLIKGLIVEVFRTRCFSLSFKSL